MTGSKISELTNDDLARFARYQKTLFFSKADTQLPKKDQITTNTFSDYATTIFNKYFKKSPIILSLFANSSLHKVYKIGDAEKLYILRINSVPFLYKELQFIFDKHITHVLIKKGIRAPHIILVDISRRLVPTDYEIYDFIVGESLYDISQRKKIPAHLHIAAGRLLSKIHSVKTEGYGPFMLPIAKGKMKGIYKNWSEYILTNLQKHISLCIEGGILTKQQAVLISTILEKNIGILKSISPVLLHGDVANHNMFLSNNELVFIDWEDAVSGDYIYDIAFFGTGASAYDNLWLSRFLKGYFQKNVIEKEFWQKYWYYFLRISLSKAVVRMNFDKDQHISSERIMLAVNELSAIA